MVAIEKYHQEVFHTPWGNLFYQLLWQQLTAVVPAGSRILDFGSGFGKTAAHFSTTCLVTAYEPNPLMVEKALAPTTFRQLQGDFTELKKQIAGEKFDFIFLHNVLEYVAKPAELLAELTRHLSPTGRFSIVKHNLLGRVYAAAILEDDPQKALAAYEGQTQESVTFGHLQTYSRKQLANWLAPTSHFSEVYGLRTVFGLSSNGAIKETPTWQAGMLALETQLSQDPVAKETAFFQHIITTR